MQSTLASRNAVDWHVAWEFQLRRKELFKEKNGGLQDVSAERDFKTGFNSHPWDEFTKEFSPAEVQETFPVRSQPFKQNRDSCISCHNFPGVYSFNSLGSVPGRLLDQAEVASFTKIHVPQSRTIVEIEKAALTWKEAQAGWKSLARQVQK